MRVTFKITRQLFSALVADLLRPHAFAAERVGWLRSRVGNDASGGVLLLAYDYHPVADEDYVNDASVGAMMGSAAIRKALQLALNDNVCMVHVHLHDHRGRPRFSRTDAREAAKFVPDLWHVRPELPHSAIVFSRDSVYGRCWYPGGRVFEITDAVIVGAPMAQTKAEQDGATRPTKLSRPK